MRMLVLSLVSLICAAAVGFVWYGSFTETANVSALDLPLYYTERKTWTEPIRPIPQTVKLNAQKVALGQKLFHDKRLSRDGTVSCASCHNLRAGGDDGRTVSAGIDGALGNINAPTVFNSGFNFVQFWDGRASTLEDQIDDPINHPKEMGANWPAIETRLRGVPQYVEHFDSLYRDGITARNIKDAIATFERSLITPNSRFDRYLNGDHAAITQDELAGYANFKSFGCVSCHQGVNVGGNMYQAFGIMLSRRDADTAVKRVDLGRFNVTGREEDKYVFKVPSLRNIALTAPYFHDGLGPDLPAAVRVMAKLQLGQQLTEHQVSAIVAFLHTLTGDMPITALK
jgi:cytochrome c peroxidase